MGEIKLPEAKDKCFGYVSVYMCHAHFSTPVLPIVYLVPVAIGGVFIKI